MNSALNYSTEVLNGIVALKAIALVLGCLVRMMCAIFNVTFSALLDVTEPDELQDRIALYPMADECLILEEEQTIEESTLVDSPFPSEPNLIKPGCLRERDAAKSFKETSQNEPLPFSEESTSVTPDDVSSLAELTEKNVLATCLDDCPRPVAYAVDFAGSPSPSPTDANCDPSKQNEDEFVAQKSNVEAMKTHLMIATGSYEKLLEFAITQGSSDTDADEASAESVSTGSTTTSGETTTPHAVVVGDRKRRNTNKKNKIKGMRRRIFMGE